VIANVLVERDLLRAVAPPPPALPVARLVDDDAVDPGPKRGVSAESVNRPEDPQEDFLREVQRFVPVAEQMEGHAISARLRLNPEFFPDIIEMSDG